MESLLKELPGKDALSSLSGGFSADTISMDAMKGLDAKDMSANLKSSLPADATSGGLGISTEGMPTKEGFMNQLSGPLDKLKGVNSKSLLGDAASGGLPIKMDLPSFDAKGITSSLTSKLLPSDMSGPNPPSDLPGFSVEEFAAPLRKLADAGAATPMRLLRMIMTVVNKFVETVSDKETLKKLMVESLKEIQIAQIEALQNGLPASALTAFTNQLLDNYEKALAALENPPDPQNLDYAKITANVRQFIQPEIRKIALALATLDNLESGNQKPLTDSLAKTIDFQASDAVLLQPYFDFIDQKAEQILGSIAEPVNKLKTMITQIQSYLSQIETKAQEAANTISTQITTNIGKVEGFLQEADQKIKDIEKQIDDFLAKIDPGPIVEKIKGGCNTVGDTVEQFFSKVEEIKLKLDTAVAGVQGQIDGKMKEIFDNLEKQIRALLNKIIEVLNRPEVKDALAKAKAGIETFKAKIQEASFKPVFDLVINKTGQLKTTVGNLDTASWGTAQKTALKVGAKVIQQVKVDEIIKPELVAAFKEIQQPLLDLIRLLKEKVLVVENMIYSFNPGTIATDFILNSDVYQTIIKTLEDFRPSKLLQPLKDANAWLAEQVAKLDPQILIDQLQSIYNKLYELLDALNPESLNKLINDTAKQARGQLEQIRDFELDAIEKTIKDSISLEKLLEGTGMLDLANADFWQTLRDLLGGAFLNDINTAMQNVRKLIAEQTSSADYNDVVAKLKTAVTAVEGQLKMDGKALAAGLTVAQTTLAEAAPRLLMLDGRRKQLLQTYQDYPDITGLLRDIDLGPVMQYKQRTVDLSSDAARQQTLATSLTAWNKTLSGQLTALKALNAKTYQDALPAIFDKQIGNPINTLVTDIQSYLKPFTDFLDEAQKMVAMLTALPGKIDAAVSQVLGTLKANLKSAITTVIGVLETLRAAIVNTITNVYNKAVDLVDSFSPYWILNSFAETDFIATANVGLPALARRLQAPAADDTLMAQIQSALPSDQLAILTGQSADALTDAGKKIVKTALSNALKSNRLGTAENVAAIKAKLLTQMTQLDATIKTAKDALAGQSAPDTATLVNNIKLRYRCQALVSQLDKAMTNYNSAISKKNPLIRLNRVLLEGAYPDDIKMSVMSLQPFIVVEISQLYPEDTVKRVDDIYVKIVDKVKTLPDQLIRGPLDDTFNQIKAILKENFDISGIFTVLDIKVAGLDQDLSQGLDRLSVVYNDLLTTLDQKLA